MQYDPGPPDTHAMTIFIDRCASAMAYLSIIVVYSVAQMALGLWVARRVTTSDFFVAGRALGPGLLFATFLAANIGAGSTIGAPGSATATGCRRWWWVGSAGIGSLVLAFWVGPRIRRLAAEHDLKTVGDFLEWRYGRRVRAIVAALLWVGTVCHPRRAADRASRGSSNVVDRHAEGRRVRARRAGGDRCISPPAA